MADVLKDLVPEFRQKVLAAVEACRTKNVEIVPYYGLRTPAAQARLWRQSRTTGEVQAGITLLRNAGAPFLADVLESVGPQPHDQEVTKVLPGDSWHQWGEAVDVYWHVDGKAVYGPETIDGVDGITMFAREAVDQGLTAGLFWPHFQDTDHVQLRSDDNPRSAGMSWPDIDATMKARFGQGPAPLIGAMAQSRSFALSAAGGRPVVEVAYTSPEGWTVYRTPDESCVAFRAMMAVDADGAPRAYNPDSSEGLDALGNAGHPGDWWALVTDAAGQPIVQGANDPAPGFYVSTTSLSDTARYEHTDPHCYVDAATVPYFVMPGGRYQKFTRNGKLRLGDLGVIYNTENRKYVFAVFADFGPQKRLGEASIAAAQALGINPDARSGGTTSPKLVYVVFPASATGKPDTAAQVDAATTAMFDAWGGLTRLQEIAASI